MRVGGVTVDWYDGPDGPRLSGTGHYRLRLPLEALARNGHETTLGSAAAATRDGSFMVAPPDGEPTHPDVVVFQRVMYAGLPDMIRRARAAGQVVLQDLDDDFWALPYGHLTAHQTSGAEWNRDHYREVVKASDGVIASTPALARRLERWNPNVHVVRNAIDLERWPVWGGEPLRAVAWIGATPWRAQDLAVLDRVLAPFLREHGWAFHHVGHVEGTTPVARRLGLTGVDCRVTPVVPFDDFPSAWPDAVVLVPLERVAFNQAKSWLRGLETSARGLPFVATDLPEYEALRAGRLARRRRGWVDALEALTDPQAQREDGARNRARAEQLSIANRWRDWASVLGVYA